MGRGKTGILTWQCASPQRPRPQDIAADVGRLRFWPKGWGEGVEADLEDAADDGLAARPVPRSDELPRHAGVLAVLLAQLRYPELRSASRPHPHAHLARQCCRSGLHWEEVGHGADAGLEGLIGAEGGDAGFRVGAAAARPRLEGPALVPPP